MEKIYFEGKKDNRQLFLIIYDITDDSRRRKISTLLEGYGSRIQYSAFEVWLTKEQYKKMTVKLEKLKKNEDKVNIYELQYKPFSLQDNKDVQEICYDIVIV